MERKAADRGSGKRQQQKQCSSTRTLYNGNHEEEQVQMLHICTMRTSNIR